MNNPYTSPRFSASSRTATSGSSSYIAYPGSTPPSRPHQNIPPPLLPSRKPIPDTTRILPGSFPIAPTRPPPTVPLPSLRGFDDNASQETTAPLSMGGMERALPTDMESVASPDSNVSEDYNTVSMGDRHEDAKERYRKGLEVISYIKEKTSYAEDASQIILRLQMAADRKIKRSYVSGTPVRDYYEHAHVIKVGIVFLPGVDRPTVTQLEQEMLMKDYKPDQMTAEWRVNTAGNLLVDFEVTKDLRVIANDTTREVVKNLRRRRDSQQTPSLRSHRNDALVLASKDKLSIVNIDSEQVTLVHDLRLHQDKFDLESTLIEVDSTAMISLLVNFQLIIQNRNAGQDLDETRHLLEAMMEDVRRLCNRSAILFRMSTRTKIITSKDIRYGVNNGREFTTLTTSKGIRKIISLSSAYYTSLDPADKIQQILRPRFLQMLVLLLSFLNDDDLGNIQEFLERTFHFRADRKNLELLFLKVIPFYSINAHVFLTSLFPIFEGVSPNNADVLNHAHYWEHFVRLIAKMGYLLPGTVDGLCRKEKSWIVQWPEKGFKDSLAFQNLQYSAHDYMRTFNEIPPIERDYDRRNENALLTAVLTNNKQFKIRVADYEAILCLTKGIYSIQEADINGQRYDLVIEESTLNATTYSVVDSLNDVIRRVNNWLTGSKSGVLRRRDSLLKVKVPRIFKPDVQMIEELRVTGKLTRYRALLGNDQLAIAYKLDGRKITLEDTLATLARNNREIQSVVEYYQERQQYYASAFPIDVLQRITGTLNKITTELSLAEGERQNIANDPTISDEPIVTLTEQPGGSFYSANIWNDYSARITTGNTLMLEAKKSYVTSVYWEQEIVVTLHNDPNQYILAPLEYVEEREREDHIQVNDVAILAGHYMILAEPVDDERSDGLIMSNYLKIVRIDQGAKVSKRQQRRMPTIAMSRPLFV